MLEFLHVITSLNWINIPDKKEQISQIFKASILSGSAHRDDVINHDNNILLFTFAFEWRACEKSLIKNADEMQ